MKSLPAKTQNLNEWFSDVVWKRVQETVFVGYETLVACDYDVVLTFDERGCELGRSSASAGELTLESGWLT